MGRGFASRPIPQAVLAQAGALHPDFVELVLPGLNRHARRRFRKMPAQFWEDCEQEARCICWKMFVNELKLGRDPLACIGKLIFWAVKQVFANWPFAGRLKADVMSRECQETHSLSCGVISSDWMDRHWAFTLD